MKWALVMYFFYFGPSGGWVETDRQYYNNELSCLNAQEIFESTSENLIVSGRVRTKCEEVEE